MTSATVTPTNPTTSFVRRRPPAAVRRRKFLLGVANHSAVCQSLSPARCRSASTGAITARGCPSAVNWNAG